MVSRNSLQRSQHLVAIGVKFCGGCNPCFDRQQMLARILERLEKYGLPFKRDAADPVLWLVINGCETACTRLPEKRAPVIRIAGWTVDFRKARDMEELVEKVTAKLWMVLEAYKVR